MQDLNTFNILLFDPNFSYFSDRYLNTTLIMETTAINKAPNAMDPQWYQVPQWMAVSKLTLPEESDYSSP